jgi:hypothetical protein
MSSLGMKIEGSNMEVGFTASTREEFDYYQQTLRLLADRIWTGAPVETSDFRRATPSFDGLSRELNAKRQEADGWKEKLGLA